jgi:hypothetical protein
MKETTTHGVRLLVGEVADGFALVGRLVTPVGDADGEGEGAEDGEIPQFFSITQQRGAFSNALQVPLRGSGTSAHLPGGRSRRISLIDAARLRPVSAT